ncbi:GyrI-like domain-containing protein [Pontibacillus salipaludis]|uniref:GyrI-like domain-containing protein n=1 Tax=Pontibacillus salipaludis TaxID=1697394 RepID=UPI0031E85FED
MNIEPKILDINKKKLVGKSMIMSFQNDRTAELWRSFMPERHQIHYRIDPCFYSLQVYPSLFSFSDVDPDTNFTKYALVEVSELKHIPSSMEVFTLPEGKYAVFIHKGPASTFLQTLTYIYETWLPESRYVIDDRPHFERLQEGYHPEDAEALEEVWVPIRLQ